MKNFFKVLQVSALVAVIGFAMAGCDNGNSPGDPGPQTVTYRGTGDDGSEYTLKITGDNYELTVTPTSGPPKTSSGTVTKTGNDLTLTPSGADPEDSFTISVNTTGGITEIEGTITFTDNSTQTAPATITPPGTLTVTGIPSEYNGKYAVFFGGSGNLDLAGYQSINVATMAITCVQITNESVSLPMWSFSYDTGQAERYSGNGTVEGGLLIADSATPNMQTLEQEPERYWNSISFSNGSATVTWASGIDHY